MSAQKLGDIVLTKQSGTILTLKTKQKYVDEDVYFNLSVVGGTAVTPDTSITANPSITVDNTGLITATVNGSENVTPTVSAGYISSGTAGTITISGSSVSQLSTQSGKTVTPTESVQTAVASGKYTTGAVKVGAISSTYVGSAIAKNDGDDLSVSENTVTAPAGYYAANASTSVPVGEVTSGTATIGSVTVSEGSSANAFILSGSATVSAPTVDTDGYISSSKGIKNSNPGGAVLNAPIFKITGTAQIARTTVKPSIGVQSVPSGVTNASAGSATTTAPSSGVYVAVRSSEKTTTVTPSVSISDAGYGTNGKHGIAGTSGVVGAAQSDLTYIPITTASPTFTSPTPTGGSTATGTNVELQSINNGIKIQTSYSVNKATIAYNNNVNGWVTKSKNDTAVETTARSSTAGTAYYIKSVTVPKSTSFSATTEADTEFNNNSTLQITNNLYREVSVNNKGAVEINHNEDSGNVYGTTKISAKFSSTSAYITATVVEDGLWKATTIGGPGTFYGRVIVNGGTAKTPTTSITVTPRITISSSGLITVSGSKSQAITPTVTAGYISSGTSGNVTATVSGTKQLTVKAATTWTPGKTNQTIAAGTYLTGTQTILGSSNLVAANIKKGIVIFGVTGTFTNTPSGKTALTAAALRSGYAGFINGNQVDGTMPDTTVTEGTTTVTDTSAARGKWEQTAGFTESRTLSVATFSNTATSGISYVDISDTTFAPVLKSSDYLYINKGWTDALKISLAKLVPDASHAGADLTSSSMLNGYTAYNNDGKIITGNIQNISSTDLTISGKTVTVPLGFYTGASDATEVTVDIADGGYSASVASQGTSTAASFTPSITGTVANIATTTTPSGVDGTDFWTIIPSGSKTNGVARAKATATIGTAGYIPVGSKTTSSYETWTLTTNVNSGTNMYIPKASFSTTGAIVYCNGAGYIPQGDTSSPIATVNSGTVKASVSSNTSGKASMSASGFTASSSATDYYVLLTTTAGSVKAKAAGDTAGYVNSSTTNETAATSVSVTGNGSKCYIPAGAVAASVSSNTNGKASMAATGMATTTTATNYYVTLTTTAGSVKAKAIGSTAGYITTNTTDETAETSVAVTGNNTKLYIKAAAISGSSTNATATTTVIPGAVTVSKQNVPSGVTQAASGNATTTAPSSGVYVAVKAAVAANSTGTTSAISGSGTATVTTAGYAPNTLTGTVTVSGTATAKTSATESSMTYVPITTASPTFSSPTPSGGSTATGTNATLNSTDNGIKIQTAYTVNQASVTYNAAVNGWVTKTSGTEAVKTTARTSTNGTAYYVSAVKLVKPSSGTRAFTVTAPDKNGTNHTYLFITDTAGNTSIKVDNTLTMQWNETDQSMDFIYT